MEAGQPATGTQTSTPSLIESKENEIALLKEKIIGQQKLVNLGMLCAGAAHEIKNPLNFIANFASINMELFQELKEKLPFLDLKEEVNDILAQIQINSDKILEHARRVESIVVNMLHQARGSNEAKTMVNLHQLIDEAINLSFHGMRALDVTFNVKFERQFDPAIKEVFIIREEITRVFYNLLHNAYYATRQKKRSIGESYHPVISIKTYDHPDNIEVVIWDNGEGIKDIYKEKLFTPFFTTKSSTEGSGLGLAISKAIVVDLHKGQISVSSQEGSWTEFSLLLPK